jgi:hypothetical protein
MAARVNAQAFQCCIQATEVYSLWAVGQAEVLLECLAPGGVLARFANPVFQQVFAGELQQWRTVARRVEQGQVGLGVVDVQQVGGGIAVDAQRAQA